VVDYQSGWYCSISQQIAAPSTVLLTAWLTIEFFEA